MSSFIQEKLKKTKIKKLQLDPFGFCNAKCWFCPVKYIPQPQEGSGNMSVDLIEKIFQDLSEEKKKINGVVDPNFNLFTTAHYNEVLLYKDIEKLFDLARKYKFQTYVLSNGISLNPKNVDLIKEYPDVVIHVGLNIPAFEKDLWAKRSGFSPTQFDRLMANLEYAKEKLSYLRKNFQVLVNGLSNASLKSITLGPEFKDLDYDLENEHLTQLELAYKIFPNLEISRGEVFDRAGYLNNVVSNENYMKERMQGKKVIGCNNSVDNKRSDRTSEWLHINSAGKVFLCCNDYNFEYQFGDVNLNSIADIWRSDRHIEVIEKAFNNICTKCLSAVLEKDRINRGAVITTQERFSRK